MTNQNTNNTELNKAIYTVITTQYKKDCREAHKAVEDAGFTISKIRGGYEVRNPKLHREVYTSDSSRYGRPYLYFNWYKRRIELTDKFDFVNCLNTPYNKIHEEDSPWMRDPKTAKEKHKRIRNSKHDIEYHGRQYDEILKKIQRLQEELVYQAKERLLAEQELERLRKEYGLCK